LPFFLVPRRLSHLVPGARGNDRHRVWSIGEGPFAMGPLAEALALRPDPDNPAHGFVEPDRRMPAGAFQQALHATQALWRIEEEGG
jgi:hypothetical protein